MVGTPEYRHIHAPAYAALVALRVVGRLEFCKCEKGQSVHAYLKGKYQDIQAKRDPFPNWQAILDEAATAPPVVMKVGG